MLSPVEPLIDGNGVIPPYFPATIYVNRFFLALTDSLIISKVCRLSGI